MSFKNLKTNRKAAFSSLKNQMEKLDGSKKSYKDERFWKLTRDSAGNGSAIIRFLPPKDASIEDDQFTMYWDYGFQGPTGQWYIERSRQTIGEDDPMAEHCSMLWNSGIEDNKELARKYGRKLNYVANILVVKDPAHPENEGRVFLFRYGKMIANMLKDAMCPPEDEIQLDEDDKKEPVNPFDMWAGASFKLVIKNNSANFPTYEASKFLSPTQVAKTDKEMEAIYDDTYSLAEFTDPAEFKSYEDLLKRRNKVLGLDETHNSHSPEPEPKTEKKVTAADTAEESEDEDWEKVMQGLENEAAE